MKKCRGFVSENGRLERHQYCPLEPCGVRGIDYKDVSLDFTRFDQLHPIRLLELKCVFRFARICRSHPSWGLEEVVGAKLRSCRLSE
jgi:hypothetical protein